MTTRTSAPDFVKDGIHMNAVDTGWVTDEDPAVHAARKAQSGFSPPLDIIDGAARIVAPIFVGRLTGTHPWGQFLKDYKRPRGEDSGQLPSAEPCVWLADGAA